MSFLSFAILGSLVCLSQCMPVMIPPVPEVAMPNYHEHIEGFMKDMSHAAENHLQPLMAELDPTDQQQVLDFGINSFINYIDYMLHVITVNEDIKVAKESLKEATDSDDYSDDSTSSDNKDH